MTTHRWDGPLHERRNLPILIGNPLASCADLKSAKAALACHETNADSSRPTRYTETAGDEDGDAFSLRR